MVHNHTAIAQGKVTDTAANQRRIACGQLSQGGRARRVHSQQVTKTGEAGQPGLVVDAIRSFHGVEVKADQEIPMASFDIESRGSAHVRMLGQYVVWPKSRYPGAQETSEISSLGKPDSELPEGALDAGFLPSLPVLPDSRRQVPMSLTRQLPPGQYVLDLNGNLGDQPLDMGIPFIVGAPDVAQGELE